MDELPALPDPIPYANNDSADPVIMSAEKLSQAFAQLMGQPPTVEQAATRLDSVDGASGFASENEPAVSPISILEAMLFVGHPRNQPLASQILAGFMRGVSPVEIDSLVVDLNRGYEQEGAAYRIVSEDGGYRMVLRDGFAPERGRFLGKVREARLSQPSIELLAIVAYNQPIDRHEVDRIRGKPSGGILNQLVRRELLVVERTKERPRRTLYRTTDRFLTLFHLECLDDLPSPEDFECSFDS